MAALAAMQLALLPLPTQAQVQAYDAPAATAEVDANAIERREALAVIDAWLKATMAFRQVPGLSAGIVSGNQLIWSAGYGHVDAAGRMPATPASPYPICSISKLYTAIATMQQVEAGRLQLDRPLTDALPWAQFHEIDPASGPVTLRGLLTHGAGVPREPGFQYWAPPFEFPSSEEVRATFAAEGQARLYGGFSHYQYSNLGLTLAGEAVAASSGQPYAEYVTQHILQPLGLTATTPFLPADAIGAGKAVGHGFPKRDGTRDELHPFDARGITPAAGFASTVEDMAKFAEWQFRLLRTGQTEVLTSGTLREMQRIQFVDPDSELTRGLGFGVYRDGKKSYVGHSGECPGFYSQILMHVPSETAAIVMMNAAEPTRPYVNAIFGIMDKRQGFSFKDIPATSVDLASYQGLYSAQPWGSERMVMPWAGGLAVLNLPSMNPDEAMDVLKPVDVDQFRRVRDDGSDAELVRFERDADGKVVRLVWHATPSERIGDLQSPYLSFSDQLRPAIQG